MMSKRAGAVTATVGAAAALLLGLSSCAIIEGPGVTPSERTPIELPADKTPEFVPGGSAEENHPYFYYVLKEYADGGGPIEGRAVADVVIDAGFDREAMQVSFDRTKTNLVADSIYVSVLLGEQCLIGQIPTESRELVTSEEPAVGPDNSICLIGDTRPIDW